MRDIMRHTFVATALALLIAGCAVDQDKEVETYRKVLDHPVLQTAATQSASPLTLDRALAMANVTSEQLNERGEDYLQSLIDKNRAVAAFLPTVTFQPYYEVEEKPNSSSAWGVGSGFRRLNNNTSQRFEAPVNGSINLFRGGGDKANVKAADAIIEQRKQLLLDAQFTVLVNVAQVFYQVLRSEQSLVVLQNSVKLQEARVQDEVQKRDNGLSTNLAVAQARAQLDNTRALRTQAEGDVINGRNTLSYVIGEQVGNTPLVDNLQVPSPRPNAETYEVIAIQYRNDIQAAQAQVEAARALVDVAVSQYYPSVNLNVQGFLYREYFSDASKWNAILSANIPIFSAGVIRADVRTAWSRLRQAAMIESDTKRSAIREVRSAYQNLITAERRTTELRGAVEASNEALRQAQAALANNLGIVLDVLTAQDAVLNSQLQLTSAEFDRSIFYLDLLRATGKLPVNLPVRPLNKPTSGPTTDAVIR